MNIQYLSIKRLSRKNIILVAAKHNHREIIAEIGGDSDGRIDPSRGGLNVVVRGASSALEVANQAQQLMDAAGIKSLRKDAVRALEVIFSVPPEFSVNHQQFFGDSIKWAEQYFQAPILSAIIHNDESVPHCHVLILPLIKGRMVGSDLHGGKTKLLAMQSDYHSKVGQLYGLKRQARPPRLSAALRYLALDAALDILKRNSGLDDSILNVILEPHLAHPEPLIKALGLEMPQSKTGKSFVEIMTRPTKPEKHIGFETRPQFEKKERSKLKEPPLPRFKKRKDRDKHIGIDYSNAQKSMQTLSCVGFQNQDAAISSNSFALENVECFEIKEDYERFRESDILSTHWNFETGEPYNVALNPSMRHLVGQQVSEAINSLSRFQVK